MIIYTHIYIHIYTYTYIFICMYIYICMYLVGVDDGALDGAVAHEHVVVRRRHDRCHLCSKM